MRRRSGFSAPVSEVSPLCVCPCIQRVIVPVCLVQLPEIVVKIAISHEFRHVVVGSLFLEQGAGSVAYQNLKITL